MRHLLPLILAVTVACDEQASARIVSVSPTEAPADRPVLLEVSVETSLPFEADHSAGTVTLDSRVQLQVGDITAFVGELPADGNIVGRVPSVLAPGGYPVILTLSNGSSVTASQELRITEGTTWPTGYEFEVIGEQERDVPFQITVRALGPDAARFEGNVRLSASRGTLSPTISEAFVGGVLTQQVMLSAQGDNFLLLLTDGAGNGANSHPFRVR